MAIKKNRTDCGHKMLPKKADSKIYFFLILTTTFIKKNPKNKAFTRSDQLSPFLINLLSTLPVHPVSLEH